ncbi:MAG: FecR domain-containing protein [Acidobacteriota bacterium]
MNEHELQDLLADRRFRPDPDDLRARLERSAPRRFGRRLIVFAAAAGVLLALTATWWSVRGGETWTLTTLDGTTRLEGEVVSGRHSLRPGQELTTASSGSAELLLGELGRVRLLEETTLRVLSAGRRWGLALERGTIEAVTVAPPDVFFVETPSGLATDLGCAFELETDEEGHGRLVVSAGWVSFEVESRRCYVPAGASCRLDPALGPGTPVRDAASPELRAALERIDASSEHGAELDLALRESRTEDALTLWHLVSRVPVASRPQVIERLESLAPRPPTVSAEAVQAGDPDALNDWLRSFSGAPVR